MSAFGRGSTESRDLSLDAIRSLSRSLQGEVLRLCTDFEKLHIEHRQLVLRLNQEIRNRTNLMSQFGALAGVATHARNGNSNIDKRRLAQDLRKVAGLIVEDVRDGVKFVQDRKGIPAPRVPSGPTPQPSSDIFATPQLYTQTTRLMLSKIFALLNIQHEIRKIDSRLVRFDEDEKRVWLSSVFNGETFTSKRGLMNEYITNINKGLSKTVIGREQLPLLEEF